MLGFWTAAIAFYLKENTTFRQLDLFLFSDGRVRKHLYTELSPTEGTFLS
jgi:hypothetical protein